MKPRDIFLKALKGERATRPATGSATSVITVDLMQKVGISFPDAHLDAEKMARLAAAGYTELGFDNIMPLFSVWHESAALGCQVEWGEANRMPDCRQTLYKIGDRVSIPSDFLTKPQCRVPLRALEILKKEFGREAAIVGKVFGPWTLGYHLFGVEEFLIHTLEEPDLIKKTLEQLKRVTLQFARAQVDAGADALCLGDHATRDLCSPESYRDFLRDLHRELRENIPCPLILHICGDTSDRIRYIRETGIPCFHFDSKVPARVARELAGEKLALMGGTSNFSIIKDGSPETISKEVKEKVLCGINIIGPECAVPLDAPWKNLRRLTEEVKQYPAERVKNSV